MNEQKQSCLTCKNFFNLKLFMKGGYSPDTSHKCLVTDINYLIGHDNNGYECECSHYTPTNTEFLARDEKIRLEVIGELIKWINQNEKSGCWETEERYVNGQVIISYALLTKLQSMME